MPYKLSTVPCWDGGGSILELGYHGAVPYSERSRALDEMSAVLQATTICRILVDFTHARLEAGPDAERVDLVSKSIVAPGFDGCRVALFGLPREQARGFITTADIRKVEARLFEDRGKAMDWLCAEAEAFSDATPVPAVT